MRLLSYNIHGGKGLDRTHDYHRIGSFLKDQAFDIVLIQEMDTRPTHRSTEQDIEDICAGHFGHFAPAPAIEKKSGWYGNAILSRYAIRNHQITDISRPGLEPRNIQEVHIATPGGDLHVVNTHKGLKRSERGHQLAKLQDIISKKHGTDLILGGDMNEWVTRARALQTLNSHLSPVNAGATFPTWFPYFHLDRLWCRPEHLIINSGVLKTAETRIFSDHYPIWADLALRQRT